MSKYKIQMVTARDAARLANIAESFKYPIYLTDGQGMRVNAKSLMGAIYTLEFEEIWLESPEALPFNDFKEFII